MFVLILQLAEETGFEPAMACTILAFQASALDHYATLPNEFILL